MNMLVQKITNTPVLNQFAKNDCCKPRKNSMFTSKTSDSISFGESKESLVTDAFLQIAKSRKQSSLGEYMGTVGKTNFIFKETKFGKEAQLSVLRNNEHATFNVSRGTNKPVAIVEAVEGNNSKNLVQIIQRFLKIVH